MSSAVAISVLGLSHRYGERAALNNVSLEIFEREIFGLLGPNGSGKTTLFRLLCTLLPIQAGSAFIDKADVGTDADRVRGSIGITFQSPSLDDRLTVAENLKYQASLYGFSGAGMRDRIDGLLDQVGLVDRRGEIVGTLSGGMKRRVEIAKGLLHDPQVLLLDEPSTGLDPGARHDLWSYLRQLREERGVTIVVTTHLMEEAEHCDRLAILNHGEVVVVDTPDALRNAIGGDCLTIECDEKVSLSHEIAERFQVEVKSVGSQLRIEQSQGHELLRELAIAFPERIRSISLGKPTLEDVFIHHTGHRFWEDAE